MSDQVAKSGVLGATWACCRAIVERWTRLSLSAQFAIISFVIIMVGMSAVAAFIAHRISESVLRNSAGSAALYMNGFVAPFLQKISPDQRMDAEAAAGLDRLLTTHLSAKIVAIKIWGPGGRILYSSERELTGKQFPETEHLKSAWAGNIVSEYDDLHDDENVLERQFNVPLVEIYSPIHRSGTGEVIAVAEFYERAEALSRDIMRARLQSVLAVGLLGLLMALSVSGIVLKGSRTIESQKLTLKVRVAELSMLLEQNTQLKARIVEASQRAADTHENVLRRVGAELHDGPTQLISLALLRLDGVRQMALGNKAGPSEFQAENIEIIKHSLDEGLREIRAICSGVSMPELNNMSFLEVVDLAVRNHKRRSQTTVELDICTKSDCPAPHAIKTAAYRFVQEGLNNSFRHANGDGQAVGVRCTREGLVIEIRDQGNGFDTEVALMKDGSLGLKGLRDRIEAVGGEFIIETERGLGTRLIARLPWQAKECADEYCNSRSGR